MSGIDARRVDEAAELLPRCLRARRRWECYTEAAHRLGVTSRFLREAVERVAAAGIRVEEVAGDPRPQAAGRRARHRFEPGRGTLVAGADRPGGDLRDVGRPWSEARSDRLPVHRARFGGDCRYRTTNRSGRSPAARRATAWAFSAPPSCGRGPPICSATAPRSGCSTSCRPICRAYYAGPIRNAPGRYRTARTKSTHVGESKTGAVDPGREPLRRSGGASQMLAGFLDDEFPESAAVRTNTPTATPGSHRRSPD